MSGRNITLPENGFWGGCCQVHEDGLRIKETTKMAPDDQWTKPAGSWKCGHVWFGQKRREEMKTGASNLSRCHALRRRVPLRLFWRQKFNSYLKKNLFIPILCVYKLIRNLDNSSIFSFQVRLMTTHHIQTLKKQREKDWMLNCIHAWLLHTEFPLAFAAVQKCNIKDYSMRDQLFLYAIFIYCTTELYQQLEVLENY